MADTLQWIKDWFSLPEHHPQRTRGVIALADYETVDGQRVPFDVLARLRLGTVVTLKGLGGYDFVVSELWPHVRVKPLAPKFICRMSGGEYTLTNRHCGHSMCCGGNP